MYNLCSSSNLPGSSQSVQGPRNCLQNHKEKVKHLSQYKVSAEIQRILCLIYRLSVGGRAGPASVRLPVPRDCPHLQLTWGYCRGGDVLGWGLGAGGDIWEGCLRSQ